MILHDMMLLCRSKLNGKIHFVGRFFHVSDRGQNNCHFDSAVKNKNMHQNKFLRRRLVLTGTIHDLTQYDYSIIRYDMI